MAENKVGDVLIRLNMFMDSDPLDFQKTGRGVLVIEDNVAELPLPKGDKGDPGPPGPPGKKLSPDLVLDETTDGAALAKLQERSASWRNGNVDRDGYFALNEPTGSGFFYTRGGWTIWRDIFGANTEITAGEFTLPTVFHNQDSEPPPPVDGVTLFAQDDQLKLKKPDGTVVTLG